MTAVPRASTGSLGDYPYVRARGGDRTLIVVPGIDDAMFDGEYPIPAAWTFRWYVSRFLDDHTVYLLSRPRGIPQDRSIAEMAEGYAEVIDRNFGDVDLLGVSMGGMIAQEIALKRPDIVDRLVVTNSGCRLPNRAALDRIRQFAEGRDWSAIRAELARAMFSDWRMVSYPPLAMTIGRFTLPRPAVPQDVTVSVAAIRAFDSSPRLGDIEVPTLVFGGTEDPYFPESILAETADGIPNASRTFLEGAKHAAFHERKPEFDARVDSFLRAA